MNARDINLEEFAIDVVLTKISEFSVENPKVKRVTISIALDYDTERFEQYEEAFRLLKKEGVIEGFRSSGKPEVVEDEFTGNHEVYLYTPSFRINQKKLNEFLVATSRIPKYTLKIDSQRRLILNDAHLLVRLQFNSTNWYFVEYCLTNSDRVITREAIEKKIGKVGKKIPKFHSVLHNLKVSPHLDAIFFPNVSRNAVEFRNNVTVEQLGSKINEDKIKRFIKTLTKVKPELPK